MAAEDIRMWCNPVSESGLIIHGVTASLICDGRHKDQWWRCQIDAFSFDSRMAVDLQIYVECFTISATGTKHFLPQCFSILAAGNTFVNDFKHVNILHKGYDDVFNKWGYEGIKSSSSSRGFIDNQESFWLICKLRVKLMYVLVFSWDNHCDKTNPPTNKEIIESS